MVRRDEGHDGVEDMAEFIAMGACNASNLTQEAVDWSDENSASFLF